MKRFTSVTAILVLSAGCHAPMPTMDMFRPATATRVAPPPTGGYGAAPPYYTTPAATVPPGAGPATIAPTSAPVGTGFHPTASNRWSNIVDPAIGPVAKENAWGPTHPGQSNVQVADLRDADVILASHEAAVPSVPQAVVVEQGGSIRILPPNSSSSLSSTAAGETLRLRGMVVNDATRQSEPQPFVPSGRVIDISQLPDAPVAANATNNPTPATSSQSSSTSQATVLDGAWKPKSTTSRVAGN